MLARTKMGAQKLSSLLQHKRAMLYFVQPSTRTFLSFQNACHLLGLNVSESRGTSTSSEVKGESPEDTIRTFASYVDLIISRHPEAGFAEKTAWVLNQTERPVPVLNGGSGPDQHPTQALLDIYTLQREFQNIGGLDGKKIAMVGDLKRGRTVRSLSYLLKNYKDVTIYYVAPEVFRMRDDIKAFLKRHAIPYLRNRQFRERDAQGRCHLHDAHPERVRQRTRRARPRPSRPTISERSISPRSTPTAPSCTRCPGVTRSRSAVDKDPRAAYWRQERNGMWIRAALIAHVFRVEEEILAEFA